MPTRNSGASGQNIQAVHHASNPLLSFPYPSRPIPFKGPSPEIFMLVHDLHYTLNIKRAYKTSAKFMVKLNEYECDTMNNSNEFACHALESYRSACFITAWNSGTPCPRASLNFVHPAHPIATPLCWTRMPDAQPTIVTLNTPHCVVFDGQVDAVYTWCLAPVRKARAVNNVTNKHCRNNN